MKSPWANYLQHDVTLTGVLRALLVGVLILVVQLGALLPAAARQYVGRVVRVSDGDTIVVMHDGAPVKIRLAEIDCPEKLQAFGTRAKQFTADHAFGREVTVVTSGRDRYGREIAQIVLADGESLNNLLIAGGYAWWYARYSHDRDKQELEREARLARRGLWADDHPLAPWDYRKVERNRRLGVL
jgi:micrococcal nuclease